MSTPDVTNLRPGRRPWQFSLRSLLVATAVVAVLCSALVSFGGLLFGLLLQLAALAVPAVLATIAVHGGGDRRTFCVGALFPSVYLCLQLSLLPYEPPWRPLGTGLGEFRRLTIWSVLCWAMAAAVGFLCVKVRRHLEKRHGRDGADPREG